MARGAPESFSDLAERLLPAVVNISTTQTIKPGERGPGFPPVPPGFEEFFKDFFERRGQQAPRRATSLGSGFVIDSSGYVVTNNHVIAEADEVTVIMQDNTSLSAEVVGRDPKTDLALLKVEADEDLTAVDWGDSDGARVGDWVVAIGNPFGLGGTVTAGIISARARDIDHGPYDDFIQTDAAINKGNSGGPLFDLDGKVIGVNTAIYSQTGTNVGIGFAVPSVLARTVIHQLREYGRTRRGWLGVRIQAVSEEIAESLGLDKPRGALVANVSEGGPAEAAKIEPGDVIITFDGRPVEEMRRLPRMVAETQIDKPVDVVVWRKGEEVSLQVKIGELDETEAAVVAAATTGVPEEAPDPGMIDELGLGLASLTGQTREKYGLSDATNGVVVTEVTDGSAAADKGLRPGDVIVEVGQEPVASAADVAEKVDAAREAGRKSVLLLLERQGDLRFVALRLG